MAGGRQWFGLFNRADAPFLAGVRQATPILDAYIDEMLAATGLAEENLLLVGFSQGTMVALHVGPLRTRRIAGIVGFGGFLADRRLGAVRSKPPILLIHGAADPIVPLADHHQTDRDFGDHGFTVETQVAPGLAHAVDRNAMLRARGFAQRALA